MIISNFSKRLASAALSALLIFLALTNLSSADSFGPGIAGQDIRDVPDRPTVIRGIWTLDMVTVKSAYGDQSTSDGAARNIDAMQKLGIRGVVGDCFLRPDFLVPMLVAADGVPNFKVAPQIDLAIQSKRGVTGEVLVQKVADAVEAWCKEGQDHKSAARTRSGKFIVFPYALHHLTIPQWQELEEKVKADGFKVYWVGQNGPELTDKTLWDEFYTFFPTTPSEGKLATLMPTYTRAGAKTNLPPDGGSRYRRQWQAAKAAGASAILIVTWNDTGDGSPIAGQKDLESITKDQGSTFAAAAPIAVDVKSGG